MKRLKAIFNKISAIETVKDLNKNKLSLHDFDVVRACFNDLSALEEENETKSAFITALKGIESLSHNNINASDYAVFMGAMQRIFDNDSVKSAMKN